MSSISSSVPSRCRLSISFSASLAGSTSGVQKGDSYQTARTEVPMARARPKSPSLTQRQELSHRKIFSGLMSRWTKPREWRCVTAPLSWDITLWTHSSSTPTCNRGSLDQWCLKNRKHALYNLVWLWVWTIIQARWVLLEHYIVGPKANRLCVTKMVGDAVGDPCFTSHAHSSFSENRVPLLLSVVFYVTASDTEEGNWKLLSSTSLFFSLTEMKAQKRLDQQLHFPWISVYDCHTEDIHNTKPFRLLQLCIWWKLVSQSTSSSFAYATVYLGHFYYVQKQNKQVLCSLHYKIREVISDFKSLLTFSVFMCCDTTLYIVKVDIEVKPPEISSHRNGHYQHSYRLANLHQKCGWE